MLRSGPGRRRLGVVLQAFLAGLALSGCVNVVPIGEDRALGLSEGRGILVLDLDSGVALDSIRIYAGTKISDSPKGRSIRLVALRAGEYRWGEITVRTLWSTVRYEPDHAEPDYRFRVEPGVINYPGRLIARQVHRKLWLRTINRSSEVVSILEKRFPKLMRRYDMRYTGNTRDDFLAYYSERVRARRGGEAGAGVGE